MSIKAEHRWRLIAAVLCLLAAINPTFAQIFADMFANQQLTSGASLTVTGSNTNATVESGEPRIDEKTGGHSVWISWQAPGDGIVTVTTDGSSFDTLLGVYFEQPGDDPPLERLESVGDDDDHNREFTSQVQFAAQSNQIYEITVDGYYGATGNILMNLSFQSSSNLVPQILGVPGDQSFRVGDPLILFLDVVPTRDMEVSWNLNGAPVSDDYYQGSTLVIPHLQDSDVGLYTADLSVGDNDYLSAPIEIQVNSEGFSQTLARNKLHDAEASELDGANGRQVASHPGTIFPAPHRLPKPLTPPTGVIAGYDGTQIFNTTAATIDPNEPPICGVVGGASYWFSYVAPAAGTMTINTTGSSFDTLLGVFTYDGVLYSYTNLYSVTCDNNSGTNLSSWVQFFTEKGRNYFVVVDGVGGARGVAYLNYSLEAGQSNTPPFVTVPPVSLVVATSTPVALNVVANGTAPFSYQWQHNGTNMNHGTSDSLLLSRPQPSDSGAYTVLIGNALGSVTSATAYITVLSSPKATLQTTPPYMVAAFPGVRGYQYGVDYSGSLIGGVWSPWTNAFPDYGGVIWLTNDTRTTNAQFLRVQSP